ncbi:MAG: beta-lactamase family protein [Sphingomonadaceae bacterium]|nr:beta-lactamase family protein [Sphingomonadaceae bacterium]
MAFRTFDQPQVSRRSLLRGGILLGAGTAMAGLPLGRELLARDTVASWPGVRATVESYVAEGKVANMVATMGWGQNAPEVIAKGVLTLGRNAPADGDSLYRIYSMTKPITGVATLMLIEDGELTLDQPLADILPAYAEMMVQKEYDGGIGEDNLEPLARPITIRHLLTHTAGLGYGIIQKGPIVKAYEEAGLVPGQVSRVPIPGLSRAKPVGSLEAFADGLAKVPLVLQPGTKWSYSVSLDLLGRVIEAVSGQPFDAFLQERLFGPLGMTSTWFRVPESEKGRLTSNYGILNGMPLPLDPADSSIYLDEPAFPFGGAGLVSSPNDYDRFQRMLVGKGVLDGTRVMAEATVRLAASNLLPDGVETKGTWVGGEGFGAGGRVTGSAFGWGGAAGTAAFADIESGLRAALFTQYMPSEAYPIQRSFPEIVLKDLAAMKGL